MLNLEDLGVTKEQLLERVIKNMSHNILYGEDGMEREFVDSEDVLEARILKKIEKKIDEKVNKVLVEVVGTSVEELVEKMKMQETTSWGEKKGEEFTFREYVAQKTSFYMMEQVTYDGRGKGEISNSYNFKPQGTRIANLIDSCLQRDIESGVSKALKDINEKVVSGLRETIKIKLGELTNSIKISTR